MLDIEIKVNGDRVIQTKPNEEYRLVEQFVDDKGQIYYDSKYCQDGYTARLNNARKYSLGITNCDPRNYKLVKITYELLEEEDVRKLHCQELEGDSKQIYVDNHIYVIDDWV